MTSQTDLKYFLEVAHSKNISRASERLGISQPSLSVSIKRLEIFIGTELLVRHKKGVLLTQAGQQLVAHAKQLLQSWEELKSQTLASCDLVQGEYKIGCHPSLGLSYLSRFLPDLLLKYPQLCVQLEYDLSRKMTERVINLSIDIGIVVNPIQHPDLVIYKLRQDQIKLWEPVKIKNQSVTLKSKNSILICDPDLAQTQWLLKALQKKNIHFSRLLPSANLEVIGSLVERGCGIGILPESLVTSLYSKALRFIPDMPTYSDDVCLIYRHENRNIKAIQAIISAIKSSMKC